MFNFNTKSLALVVSLLIVSSISGYLVYASVWLGPPGIAPGNNVSQPINIGTTDQDKTGRISAVEFYDADDSSFYINPSGNSSISGILTVGGDISDGAKTIYDSASGRLDYSVLPYHKGDLTSDWANNVDTSSYYDVANLAVGNIKSGIGYGRGNSGTLALTGNATPGDVRSGKTFYGNSWTQQTGTAGVCDSSWHYLWAVTYSGGCSSCVNFSSASSRTCSAATVGSTAWGQQSITQLSSPAYSSYYAEGCSWASSTVYWGLTCRAMCY